MKILQSRIADAFEKLVELTETLSISVKGSLLLFAILAFFLSFEYFGFGPSSYVDVHDNADVTLALKLARGEAHGDGNTGFWDRHQIGGTDALTEVGTVDFTNVLFDVLPGWMAYGGLMFIQRFLAGIFTYLVLTKHLSVKPVFALPSAIFFAMFPQRQINLQFQGFTTYDSLGLPGIPVVLFFVGKLANFPPKSLKRVVWLAAVLGFLYAGVSFFAYSIFFFPLVAFWLLWIHNKRHFLPILFGLLLGWFCLEFFEFAASYNFSLFSQRQFRSYCLPGELGVWTDAIQSQLIATKNFPPFVIAGLALLLPVKTRLYKSLVAYFVLAGVFFFAGILFTQFACSFLNPFQFLRGFNLSRFYLYFPFLVSVLLAIGLQHLYARAKVYKGPIRRLLSGFTVFLSLALLAFFGHHAIQVKVETNSDRMAGSNFADIYENPYLELLAQKTLITGPVPRAVVLHPSGSTLHPGFLWPYGINTLDGYANLYTLRFREYWKAIIDPMMKQYPDCRIGVRLDYGETRLYLTNACDVGQEVDITRPEELFNLELLKLGGVRYLVSEIELISPELQEIDTSSVSCPLYYVTCTRYYLYDLTNSTAYVTAWDQAEVFYSNDALLKSLSQLEDLARLNEIYVLAENVDINAFENLGSSPVSLDVNWVDSDRISVAFFSEDAKLILINQTYTKDWHVAIDGEQGQLFPAFHVFSAALIPAGEHNVEFYYSPPYLPNELLDRTVKQIRGD